MATSIGDHGGGTLGTIPRYVMDQAKETELLRLLDSGKEKDRQLSNFTTKYQELYGPEGRGADGSNGAGAGPAGPPQSVKPGSTQPHARKRNVLVKDILRRQGAAVAAAGVPPTFTTSYNTLEQDFTKYIDSQGRPESAGVKEKEMLASSEGPDRGVMQQQRVTIGLGQQMASTNPKQSRASIHSGRIGVGPPREAAAEPRQHVLASLDQSQLAEAGRGTGAAHGNTAAGLREGGQGHFELSSLGPKPSGNSTQQHLQKLSENKSAISLTNGKETLCDNSAVSNAQLHQSSERRPYGLRKLGDTGLSNSREREVNKSRSRSPEDQAGEVARSVRLVDKLPAGLKQPLMTFGHSPGEQPHVQSHQRTLPVHPTQHPWARPEAALRDHKAKPQLPLKSHKLITQVDNLRFPKGSALEPHASHTLAGPTHSRALNQPRSLLADPHRHLRKDHGRSLQRGADDKIPSINFKTVHADPEQIYSLLNHKSRLLQPTQQRSLVAYSHGQGKRPPADEGRGGDASSQHARRQKQGTPPGRLADGVLVGKSALQSPMKGAGTRPAQLVGHSTGSGKSPGKGETVAASFSKQTFEGLIRVPASRDYIETGQDVIKSESRVDDTQETIQHPDEGSLPAILHQNQTMGSLSELRPRLRIHAEDDRQHAELGRNGTLGIDGILEASGSGGDYGTPHQARPKDQRLAQTVSGLSQGVERTTPSQHRDEAAKRSSQKSQESSVLQGGRSDTLRVFDPWAASRGPAAPSSSRAQQQPPGQSDPGSAGSRQLPGLKIQHEPPSELVITAVPPNDRIPSKSQESKYQLQGTGPTSIPTHALPVPRGLDRAGAGNRSQLATKQLQVQRSSFLLQKAAAPKSKSILELKRQYKQAVRLAPVNTTKQPQQSLTALRQQELLARSSKSIEGRLVGAPGKHHTVGGPTKHYKSPYTQSTLNRNSTIEFISEMLSVHDGRTRHQDLEHELFGGMSGASSTLNEAYRDENYIYERMKQEERQRMYLTQQRGLQARATFSQVEQERAQYQDIDTDLVESDARIRRLHRIQMLRRYNRGEEAASYSPRGGSALQSLQLLPRGSEMPASRQKEGGRPPTDSPADQLFPVFDKANRNAHLKKAKLLERKLDQDLIDLRNKILNMVQVLQESHDEEEIEKLIFFEAFLRNVAGDIDLQEFNFPQSLRTSLMAASSRPGESPPRTDPTAALEPSIVQPCLTPIGEDSNFASPPQEPRHSHDSLVAESHVHRTKIEITNRNSVRTKMDSHRSKSRSKLRSLAQTQNGEELQPRGSNAQLAIEYKQEEGTASPAADGPVGKAPRSNRGDMGRSSTAMAAYADEAAKRHSGQVTGKSEQAAKTAFSAVPDSSYRASPGVPTANEQGTHSGDVDRHSNPAQSRNDQSTASQPAFNPIWFKGGEKPDDGPIDQSEVAKTLELIDGAPLVEETVVQLQGTLINAASGSQAEPMEKPSEESPSLAPDQMERMKKLIGPLLSFKEIQALQASSQYRSTAKQAAYLRGINERFPLPQQHQLICNVQALALHLQRAQYQADPISWALAGAAAPGSRGALRPGSQITHVGFLKTASNFSLSQQRRGKTQHQLKLTDEEILSMRQCIGEARYGQALMGDVDPETGLVDGGTLTAAQHQGFRAVRARELAIPVQLRSASPTKEPSGSSRAMRSIYRSERTASVPHTGNSKSPYGYASAIVNERASDFQASAGHLSQPNRSFKQTRTSFPAHAAKSIILQKRIHTQQNQKIDFGQTGGGQLVVAMAQHGLGEQLSGENRVPSLEVYGQRAPEQDPRSLVAPAGEKGESTGELVLDLKGQRSEEADEIQERPTGKQSMQGELIAVPRMDSVFRRVSLDNIDHNRPNDYCEQDAGDSHRVRGRAGQVSALAGSSRRTRPKGKSTSSLRSGSRGADRVIYSVSKQSNEQNDNGLGRQQTQGANASSERAAPATGPGTRYPAGLPEPGSGTTEQAGRALAAHCMDNSGKSSPGATHQHSLHQGESLAIAGQDDAAQGELRGKQMKLDANPSVQRSLQKLELVRKPIPPEQPAKRGAQASGRQTAAAQQSQPPEAQRKRAPAPTAQQLELATLGRKEDSRRRLNGKTSGANSQNLDLVLSPTLQDQESSPIRSRPSRLDTKRDFQNQARSGHSSRQRAHEAVLNVTTQDGADLAGSGDQQQLLLKENNVNEDSGTAIQARPVAESPSFKLGAEQSPDEDQEEHMKDPQRSNTSFASKREQQERTKDPSTVQNSADGRGPAAHVVFQREVSVSNIEHTAAPTAQVLKKADAQPENATREPLGAPSGTRRARNAGMPRIKEETFNPNSTTDEHWPMQSALPPQEVNPHSALVELDNAQHMFVVERSHDQSGESLGKEQPKRETRPDFAPIKQKKLEALIQDSQKQRLKDRGDLEVFMTNSLAGGAPDAVDQKFKDNRASAQTEQTLLLNSNRGHKDERPGTRSRRRSKTNSRIDTQTYQRQGSGSRSSQSRVVVGAYASHRRGSSQDTAGRLGLDAQVNEGRSVGDIATARRSPRQQVLIPQTRLALPRAMVGDRREATDTERGPARSSGREHLPVKASRLSPKFHVEAIKKNRTTSQFNTRKQISQGPSIGPKSSAANAARQRQLHDSRLRKQATVDAMRNLYRNQQLQQQFYSRGNAKAAKNRQFQVTHGRGRAVAASQSPAFDPTQQRTAPNLNLLLPPIENVKEMVVRRVGAPTAMAANSSGSLNPLDVTDKAQERYGRDRLLDDIQAMSELGMTLRGEQQSARPALASRDLKADGAQAWTASQVHAVDLGTPDEPTAPRTQSQVHRQTLYRQQATAGTSGREARAAYGPGAGDHSQERSGAPASSFTDPSASSQRPIDPMRRTVGALAAPRTVSAFRPSVASTQKPRQSGQPSHDSAQDVIDIQIQAPSQPPAAVGQQTRPKTIVAQTRVATESFARSHNEYDGTAPRDRTKGRLKTLHVGRAQPRAGPPLEELVGSKMKLEEKVRSGGHSRGSSALAGGEKHRLPFDPAGDEYTGSLGIPESRLAYSSVPVHVPRVASIATIIPDEASARQAHAGVKVVTTEHDELMSTPLIIRELRPVDRSKSQMTNDNRSQSSAGGSQAILRPVEQQSLALAHQQTD